MTRHQLQVVFSRPIDDWSGQGQTLRVFLNLVAPHLPYEVALVDTLHPSNGLVLYWDMQDYCRMVGRASQTSIVWIGGMQPPDFWPGEPLPERLAPLKDAAMGVASGNGLAMQLEVLLGREVLPIAHCIDLETFKPNGSRGKDIVAVSNNVNNTNGWHYGVDRLKATDLPIRYIGWHHDGLAEKVPHGQMPEIYRNAAVFVRVSRHEGGCLSRCEALACGVPQVGSLAGEAESQINGNGVLLSQADCDDPKMLRWAIESVAEAAGDVWEEMSKRSRLIAVSRYHPRQVVQGWQKIFKKMKRL